MKKIFTFVAAAFVALTMNAEVLTVAQAIEAGMALDSMATSETEYTVEGYVINAGAFSMTYHNQSWYMADDAAAAASDFQAYNCYPIQGNDTLKVLNGDKVQLVGKLKKYYNKSAAKYIIEMEKANASFITMADGDHTVVEQIEEATVAQALAIGNALANGGVTEKQYKIRGYVSAVDVKSSDAYSEQYGNQSFYVADAQGSTASTNADGAFYVYRGKPSTGAAIPYGAQVEFTCTIKKYVPSQGDPVIENADQNIVITVLDAPAIEYDTMTVAQAVEVALALGDNEESAQNYAVVGFVAKVKDAYSEQYKNISFYMADDATATYGDLYAYRAKISAEEGAALQAGDKVLVIGKLKNNFYNDKNSAQFVAGAEASLLAKGQGIENIVVPAGINKVIVDGELYIIREGKWYNVQGTQVR